jgi:hypothetical protein
VAAQLVSSPVVLSSTELVSYETQNKKPLDNNSLALEFVPEENCTEI